MSTRPSEKVLTAFHEAGHAITAATVSKSNGARIDSLGLSGAAWTARSGNVVQDVAIALAGSVCEWLRDGRHKNRFSYMSPRDLSNVDQRLHDHYKREMKAEETPEFWQAVIVAEDVLHANWGAIEHTARRLATKEVISGGLVAAILAEHKRKEIECQSANLTHRKTA